MNTVLSDGEITGTIAEIVRTPFPPMYFDENMVAIHKVVEKQDAFTRLELAKAVRKLIKNNLYTFHTGDPFLTGKYAGYNEALQTVLKVMEGK